MGARKCTHTNRHTITHRSNGFTHAHAHTPTNTHILICQISLTHKKTHTHTYKHTHKNTHTHIHIPNLSLTHTSTHTDTHTHTHTRIHTYKHKNTYVPWEHAMTHSYVWHDAFICVPWRIHMCDMTHSYVWHDAFICVTWRIHICDMTHSYVWHDTFICVTWRIHMRDLTHSYVWHGAFIIVAALNDMRDMTHSFGTHSHTTKIDMTHSYVAWLNCDSFRFVCRDSFIYVTWLMSLWLIPKKLKNRDSFICGATQLWLILICVTGLVSTWETWLVAMCGRIYTFVWY